jgi:hypothetical protein
MFEELKEQRDSCIFPRVRKKDTEVIINGISEWRKDK